MTVPVRVAPETWAFEALAVQEFENIFGHYAIVHFRTVRRGSVIALVEGEDLEFRA